MAVLAGKLIKYSTYAIAVRAGLIALEQRSGGRNESAAQSPKQ